MASKNITEVVTSIVKELSPLSPEDRRRVIQASLVLLGDTPVAPLERAHESQDDAPEAAYAPRARAWMRQNGISMGDLQQVFHIENGDCQLIASTIPGTTNRERVRNAYQLMGAARLVLTGEARFDDKDARALCDRFGFFDPTNHSKYMKGGNELTGSREKGWTLTAPGLKQAALLISELNRTS